MNKLTLGAKINTKRKPLFDEKGLSMDTNPWMYPIPVMQGINRTKYVPEPLPLLLRKLTIVLM